MLNAQPVNKSNIDNKISTFRFLFDMVMKRKMLFFVFITLSTLTAFSEVVGITLLVPVLKAINVGESFNDIPIFKYISNYFQNDSIDQQLIQISIALLVIFILKGILQYSSLIMSSLLPIRIMESYSNRNYERILSVDMSYINRKKVGEHTVAIVGHPSRISSVLKYSGEVVIHGMMFCFYMSLMFILSWRLTIAALALMLVLSIFMKLGVNRKLSILGNQFTQTSQTLHQIGYETLNSMKLIKLLVAENRMIRTFRAANREQHKAQLRSNFFLMLVSPVFTTASGVIVCGILLAVAIIYKEQAGAFLGEMILFLLVLHRMMGPVASINSARLAIIPNLHAVEELQRFERETRAAIAQNGTIPITGFTDSIRFENVCFHYDDESGPALHNLNLEIPRGQMVAVVGPSGAGKTTLTALLTRLYDPSEGRILVDGQDLRELDISAWRHLISTVSQDISLFNDSVSANIAFGRPDASPEEIRQAATLASAHNFIEELPQGYDSLLGDRGVRLSGGQQQRIAIARAILANPQLLILDEATSHLDTVTEQAIRKAVTLLSKDRTVLVIAHRLSTIHRADSILVMKNGSIIEQGRHDELMAGNGTYAEMIRLQSLDLVDDEDTSGTLPVT